MYFLQTSRFYLTVLTYEKYEFDTYKYQLLSVWHIFIRRGARKIRDRIKRRIFIQKKIRKSSAYGGNDITKQN